MTVDSLEGIKDTLNRCTVISKSVDGIGLSIHIIRATWTYIRGINATSNGVVPMLRVYKDTGRAISTKAAVSARKRFYLTRAVT